MVTVEFLGPIGLEPIEIEVTNILQLKDIFSKNDNLKDWLKNSAIAVNDELVKQVDFPLKDGDKVAILPPVCGG